MTNWLIIAFFGVALVIGIYFTWILLRTEMNGTPRRPPTDDDFGFGPESTPTPNSHIHLSHPRH